MTEITDGSGVTYPAEVYQAVFMEAHRLRAENERLRVALQTVRDHYAAHHLAGHCCLTCDQIAQDGLQ